jgi:dolichyl-phosphate-mannose--protein O-mannosyl transferase
MSVSRIGGFAGTLGELLDTLKNDAFMPLHYELLNWIRQGFPLGFGFKICAGGILLTPTAMRFVPALSGTLMTPVMYFLARQMFNRRTAIIRGGVYHLLGVRTIFFAHTRRCTHRRGCWKR